MSFQKNKDESAGKSKAGRKFYGKWKTGIDEPAKMVADTRLEPNQAFEKIKGYCAYQERCHKDVKEKLYSYGLHRQEVESMLSRLIEENFLNEERFAIAYARGHASTKQWGRIKISQGLKQKGVSTYCIKRGLQAIDDEAYHEVLQRLAEKKWEALRREKPMARKYKCRQFLLQRGFESNLLDEVIKIAAADDLKN